MQLSEWIADQKRKGMGNNQIKEYLKNSGYKENDIMQIFGKGHTYLFYSFFVCLIIILFGSDLEKSKIWLFLLFSLYLYFFELETWQKFLCSGLITATYAFHEPIRDRFSFEPTIIVFILFIITIYYLYKAYKELKDSAIYSSEQKFELQWAFNKGIMFLFIFIGSFLFLSYKLPYFVVFLLRYLDIYPHNANFLMYGVYSIFIYLLYFFVIDYLDKHNEFKLSFALKFFIYPTLLFLNFFFLIPFIFTSITYFRAKKKYNFDRLLFFYLFFFTIFFSLIILLSNLMDFLVGSIFSPISNYGQLFYFLFITIYVVILYYYLFYLYHTKIFSDFDSSILYNFKSIFFKWTNTLNTIQGKPDVKRITAVLFLMLIIVFVFNSFYFVGYGKSSYEKGLEHLGYLSSNNDLFWELETINKYEPDFQLHVVEIKNETFIYDSNHVLEDNNGNKVEVSIDDGGKFCYSSEGFQDYNLKPPFEKSRLSDGKYYYGVAYSDLHGTLVSLGYFSGTINTCRGMLPQKDYKIFRLVKKGHNYDVQSTFNIKDKSYNLFDFNIIYLCDLDNPCKKSKFSGNFDDYLSSYEGGKYYYSLVVGDGKKDIYLFTKNFNSIESSFIIPYKNKNLRNTDVGKALQVDYDFIFDQLNKRIDKNKQMLPNSNWRGLANFTFNFFSMFKFVFEGKATKDIIDTTIFITETGIKLGKLKSIVSSLISENDQMHQFKLTGKFSDGSTSIEEHKNKLKNKKQKMENLLESYSEPKPGKRSNEVVTILGNSHSNFFTKNTEMYLETKKLEQSLADMKAKLFESQYDVEYDVKDELSKLAILRFKLNSLVSDARRKGVGCRTDESYEDCDTRVRNIIFSSQ